MKIKIKYSYTEDALTPFFKCQADAYRRLGICSIYSTWGSSFAEARAKLMTYLHNWRYRVAQKEARELEKKLNPPPTTEIIEI